MISHFAHSPPPSSLPHTTTTLLLCRDFADTLLAPSVEPITVTSVTKSAYILYDTSAYRSLPRRKGAARLPAAATVGGVPTSAKTGGPSHAAAVLSASLAASAQLPPVTVAGAAGPAGGASASHYLTAAGGATLSSSTFSPSSSLPSYASDVPVTFYTQRLPEGVFLKTPIYNAANPFSKSYAFTNPIMDGRKQHAECNESADPDMVTPLSSSVRVVSSSAVATLKASGTLGGAGGAVGAAGTLGSSMKLGMDPPTAGAELSLQLIFLRLLRRMGDALQSKGRLSEAGATGVIPGVAGPRYGGSRAASLTASQGPLLPGASIPPASLRLTQARNMQATSEALVGALGLGSPGSLARRSALAVFLGTARRCSHEWVNLQQSLGCALKDLPDLSGQLLLAAAGVRQAAHELKLNFPDRDLEAVIGACQSPEGGREAFSLELFFYWIRRTLAPVRQAAVLQLHEAAARGSDRGVASVQGLLYCFNAEAVAEVSG